MMTFLKHLIMQASVLKLTRAACLFALVGLALMSYSLFDPRAIPVIVAMSVGHAFGFVAFGCYLLAVLLDVRRLGAESARPGRANSASHSHAESER